jgi:branched-chain amino acid transport system permease protein
MNLFLQALVDGIMMAAIYALVALGLTLVFGLLDIVNFAHGQLLLFGSYLVCAFVGGHASYWIALPVSVVLLGMLGYGIDFALFARVRRSPISGLIISIGLIAVFSDIFTSVWGVNEKIIPAPVTTVFRPGGLTIPADQLIAVAAALVVMAALVVFLRFTRAGVALRATADNPEAAALMGIPVERVRNVAFALGAALSGLAGGLLAGIYPTVPSGGDSILVTGFIVLILGGAGSPLGAVIAALVVALIESFGVVYWTSSAATITGFVVLILVLFLRPSGLISRSREVTL